jgi:hypothetical protein
MGPLRIDSVFYIHMTGLTFDNNYKSELATGDLVSTYPAAAISIIRCQGVVLISSLTVQNYAGFDIEKLKTLIDPSYIIDKDPTQRTVLGSPKVIVESPKFTLDYGFRTQIIKFGQPSSNTEDNFENTIYQLTINGLVLKNISYYNPSQSQALFSNINSQISNVDISNIEIDNVSIISSQSSIFSFSNKGDLNINTASIKNVNLAAYNFDTENYSYVSVEGAVFSIVAPHKENGEDPYNYNLQHLALETIYGKNGPAFYFTMDMGGTSHTIITTLNNVTIKNCNSYLESAVYFRQGDHQVTITNSVFESNTAVQGSADMYVETASSLQVQHTQFLYPSTVRSASASSIFIMMIPPYSFLPVFTNITLMCEDDSAYDNATYIGLLADTSTFHTYSPILINPGQLKTVSSTFKNCK